MPSKTFDASRMCDGLEVAIGLPIPLSMRLAPFVVQLFMETVWNSSRPAGFLRCWPSS